MEHFALAEARVWFQLGRVLLQGPPGSHGSMLQPAASKQQSAVQDAEATTDLLQAG